MENVSVFQLKINCKKKNCVAMLTAATNGSHGAKKDDSLIRRIFAWTASEWRKAKGKNETFGHPTSETMDAKEWPMAEEKKGKFFGLCSKTMHTPFIFYFDWMGEFF